MTGFDSTAIAGLADIVEEEGHYVIYIEVMFMEKIVRKRIRSYATRAEAEVAARLMGYALNRNLTPDGVRVDTDHDQR